MTKTIHDGKQYFKHYDATDVRFSRIYLSGFVKLRPFVQIQF